MTSAIDPSEIPAVYEPDRWRGFIMLPEDVTALTGQQVHPEVFSVEPTGNLIHVVLEIEPKEYGNIIIPASVQNAAKMGCGYIIAAGPEAGSPLYAHNPSGPVGVTRDSPALLLGLHVIFAQYVGVPLRVSLLDTEYKAAVLILSSKDVQGVDNNPESLTARAERRSKE